MVDADAYDPYVSSLRLLQAVLACHPGEFRWKTPPYEYEFEKQPIDLIIGGREIRQRLESVASLESIAASWKAQTDEFQHTSRAYHLYD